MVTVVVTGEGGEGEGGEGEGGTGEGGEGQGGLVGVAVAVGQLALPSAHVMGLPGGDTTVVREDLAAQLLPSPWTLYTSGRVSWTVPSGTTSHAVLRGG